MVLRQNCYEARKQTILSYLKDNPFATASEIAQLTGVSIPTTRRDFLAMDQEGLIIRSHGSIQARDPSFPPSVASISSSSRKDSEKMQIAQFAASLVHENDCIFIGAGKTCALFASCLKKFEFLTVVTTSISAVLQLVDYPNISLTLLGGDVHTGSNFIETISPTDELDRCLGPLFFNKVFITVDGVDLNNGYTVRNPRQLQIYSRLLQSSGACFALIDSAKFNRRSFISAFEMSQIKNVITTKPLSNMYQNFYHDNNINLYLV